VRFARPNNRSAGFPSRPNSEQLSELSKEMGAKPRI